MRDQLVKDATAYTTQEKNMHAFRKIESETPAMTRSQTYALDHTVSEISICVYTYYIYCLRST